MTLVKRLLLMRQPYTVEWQLTSMVSTVSVDLYFYMTMSESGRDVCVCTHTCESVSVCVSVRAYMWVCFRVCVCACESVSVCACVCVYMWVCFSVCVLVCNTIPSSSMKRPGTWEFRDQIETANFWQINILWSYVKMFTQTYTRRGARARAHTHTHTHVCADVCMLTDITADYLKIRYWSVVAT